MLDAVTTEAYVALAGTGNPWMITLEVITSPLGRESTEIIVEDADHSVQIAFMRDEETGWVIHSVPKSAETPLDLHAKPQEFVDAVVRHMSRETVND